MRAAVRASVILALLLPTIGFGTTISYRPSELEAGRWQYTYSVANVSLAQSIQEFTIWFDYGLYGNLAVETLDPLASRWDEIVWQPEPILEDAGAYDALALADGIPMGLRISGFAVSFDWPGDGEPGSQFYQIVDPGTFETMNEGQTILVPEPATLLLLAAAMLQYLVRRSKAI